ncbi:ABC transporter permease subunit [Neobacillus jeddahensis]|uniref:ABC transporter permease subunit n=1 Tax=Neobacillus jeddahensis TaxID=1461580 RepID=UPI00058BE38D|nr:ABC transporter permease subunit [Neobacillus jeddahensis]
MKRVLRSLIRIGLILAGFFFIFHLPTLFGIGKDSVEIHGNIFWMAVNSDLQSILQIMDPMYLRFFKELEIAESYQYSMTILFASLVVIIIAAIGMALLILIVPEKVRNRLKSGVNFFEAVPDLLIIFLFQFFVITLYKTTGLKFLQLYGMFGHKPYFVPIVTVSFLPMFLLLQFLIRVMTEEQSQPYVLYAKAKGIGRVRTLFIHIIRNVFPLLVLQLRTIIWVLLSNIYLVESLFNINGFTRQFFIIIQQGGDFTSLVLCLLMFCLPLLIIEAIGWLLSKRIKGKEAISL